MDASCGWMKMERDEGEGFIRPFDPFQDLEPVVELIGVAFGYRLDPSGRATLARMRRFARAGPLLQWLWAFLGRAAMAPGLVWVEDGRVVGNVSLRRARGHGGYLIGNVVVDPDWRGQGIATALMEAAIRKVSKWGAWWVGLEVRADNGAARSLYEGLDFQEVGRTLHLLRPAGCPWRGLPPSTGTVRRAKGGDRDALIALMHAVIPEAHRPLLEVHESDYQPGWIRTLELWLRGVHEVWWVVDGDEGLQGAIRAVRKTGRFPNRLEILAKSDDDPFEVPLVKHGLASLDGSPHKPIETSLAAPTDRLVATLEREGFHEMHVLVQMKRRLGHRIPVTIKDQKKTGPL
jgi:ribosomal protein S18 acetylase RimI-like enzyme